jgi:hypothetical protein
VPAALSRILAGQAFRPDPAHTRQLKRLRDLWLGRGCVELAAELDYVISKHEHASISYILGEHEAALE